MSGEGTSCWSVYRWPLDDNPSTDESGLVSTRAGETIRLFACDLAFSSSLSRDLVIACVILSLLALKSMSLSSGGLPRLCWAVFFSFSNFCCALNFSAIRARDEAVEALETGRRGRELLRGGDFLGGGAMMFARNKGLFAPDGIGGGLGVVDLPRRPGEVILP